MMPDLYQVADGLHELRRQLADYEGCGVVLDGEQVTALRRELSELAMASRRQAHELSRLAWNDAARRDREEAVVMAEISRPDTNVLPFAPDQVFSDGRAR